MIPRDTRFDLFVCLDECMQGGSACHAAVELDLVDSGPMLAHYSNEPFDELIVGSGNCLDSWLSE